MALTCLGINSDLPFLPLSFSLLFILSYQILLYTFFNKMETSSYVVFSGGSACNHILDGFHKTSAHDVSYILGISDNGGSTVR